MKLFDLYSSDSCPVCGQTPCNCTHIAEEKVRLDPKCWKGKKIGNPKTKVKGGVRVNNCVPAESIAEGAPAGMVRFVLDSERAYEAVMARYGDIIQWDNNEYMMVPAKVWPRVEQVAYDADGIGAEDVDQGGDYENPEHYGVAETTGVTDYTPKSQGGTRKELLAKYHKTKNPKDAEAARKAGATQKELQGVAEDLDSYEFHTSVPVGDFLPSRHGKEKYLYLHDMTKKSGDGRGPMLVTVERPGTAVEIANEFGGKAVKTKLGTYRIVKPRESMEEGAGNVGAGIKSLFQKIYNQGDDEFEYFYNESPVFSLYWDEYEGDLDSIIAEVNPKELQIIHDELESYVEGAGLAEGIGRDMAKLGGIAAAGIGAGLAGNYLDQQQPRVQIGDKQAYYVENPGWGRVPDNAMTVTGKDGKEYKLWATRGQGGPQWYATPAEKVKEDQINEISPYDYDSDEDYRDALRASKRKPSYDDDYDDEPEDDSDDESYYEKYVRTKGLEEAGKKSEPPEADYGDEYQAMVRRVKHLAGLGPLKTVYDPVKRVYKNVPVAQQPKEQPKK